MNATVLLGITMMLMMI